MLFSELRYIHRTLHDKDNQARRGFEQGRNDGTYTVASGKRAESERTAELVATTFELDVIPMNSDDDRTAGSARYY